MSATLLRVDQLRKSFATADGELEILRGVTLEVNEGDFISITGPSGVGKSTLLHILGGLDRPTSGSVTVDDRQIEMLAERELAAYRNREVGFVFQFHYLLEELSALENVIIPLLVREEPRNKARQRGLSLLDQVDLRQRANHLPGQLSGGECQRVAIARAMAGAPNILLADEPTGDLDGVTAENLHQLFEQLNRQANMTIIVATHDLSLADRASRRFHMSNGLLTEKSE